MNLLNIVPDLIKSPKKTWLFIKTESYSTKNIIQQFLFPIIIAASILKVLGRFINLHDFSIINSALSSFAFIFISFSVILISALIINELLPKFKLKKDFNLVIKIISFSSFPAIIANGLSDLHPHLSFLNIISIYTIILFWTSTVNCLQIPKEHTTGFVLISLIIVSASLFIISFTTMTVFLSIFFNL
jgi:hypothetical protein